MKRKAVETTAYVVVDVSSIAHRAYHARRNLTTSDGRISGHVYGFLRDLHSVLKDHGPSTVVFCYDRDGADWRREILDKYPLTESNRSSPEGYKRNRLSPDEKYNPCEDVERLAFNLPGYHMYHPGFEADDMVAAFVFGSRKETGRTGGIGILSGDKDLWQLISDEEDVFCLFPKREKNRSKGIVKITEEDVISEFGVAPRVIPKVKALLGDSSDNIVGVLNASRPGKADACKIVARDVPAYFKKGKFSEVEFPDTVPEWLTTRLREQRKRLRANYKVTNLEYAVRRLLRTRTIDDDGKRLPMRACRGTKQDMKGALDVLAEFECKQLISQYDDIVGYFLKPE